MAHLLLVAVVAALALVVVVVVVRAFIPHPVIGRAALEHLGKVIPGVSGIKMTRRPTPMVEVEVVKALLAALLVTALPEPVVMGLQME